MFSQLAREKWKEQNACSNIEKPIFQEASQYKKYAGRHGHQFGLMFVQHLLLLQPTVGPNCKNSPKIWIKNPWYWLVIITPATVWQILNTEWTKWTETKLMWICWNLLGKIREITSGQNLFLAGFSHLEPLSEAAEAAVRPWMPI